MGVTRCSWACIVLVLSRAGTGAAAIRFEHFASVQGLTVVGDAAVTGKTLRLTPAKGDRSGAAWFREKQPVGSGFDTTFQFQLTHQGGLGHGADELQPQGSIFDCDSLVTAQQESDESNDKQEKGWHVLRLFGPTDSKSICYELTQ